MDDDPHRCLLEALCCALSDVRCSELSILHDDSAGLCPAQWPLASGHWNHAKAIVACDLFVVVTAPFRVLYVFVVMEIGTRRIVHQNVTAHPKADWTLQQFREALPGDHAYRYMIHDRDRILLGIDETNPAEGIWIVLR